MGFKGKKILIVEDEKAISNILTKGLKEIGFKVLCAQNGDEGLRMAIKNKPDLILLDILMPLMNGLEMAKKLREDPWGKKALIIVLTNLSLKEDEAARLNIHSYVTKANIEINDLIDMIKEKLS